MKLLKITTVNLLKLLSFLLIGYASYGQKINFLNLENRINEDSLEKKLDSSQPNIYLNQLIILENSWLNSKNKKFGTKLSIVSSLCAKTNRTDASMIKDYLEGKLSVLQRLPDRAFVSFNKSLTVAKSLKDTSGIIHNNIFISDLFLNQTMDKYRDLEKGKLYSEEAARIASLHKDNLLILKSYKSLSNVYSYSPNKNVELKQLVDKSLKIIDANKTNKEFKKFRILVLNDMALYYMKSGNTIKAFETFKEITIEKSQFPSLYAYYAILFNTIYVGLQLKKYNECEKLALEIINDAKSEELQPIRTDAFETLKLINQAKGNYLKALMYADSNNILKETVFRADSKQKLSELELQYRTKETELNNKKLQSENEFVKRRNQDIIKGAIVGAILITLLIITLVFLTKNRAKVIEQNNEISRLSKIKDRYFKIISHDLKSPLDSYQKMGESIKYLINTKQFERLQLLTNQVEIVGVNLTIMLTNLLNWNKTQDLTFEPTLERISLTDAINSILAPYLDLARIKEIDVVQNMERESFVNADANTLATILRNLFDNAIKNCYLPKKVFINLERLDSDNTYQLSIKNTFDQRNITEIQEVIAFLNDKKKEVFSDLSFGLELIKQFSKTNNIKVFAEVNETIFIVNLTFKKTA